MNPGTHDATPLRLLDFALGQILNIAILCDEQGRISYANAAACRDLGYAREELHGLSIIDIVPHFTPATWQMHWQDVLAQTQLRCEISSRRKNGEVFPAEFNLSIFPYQGNTYSLVLIRGIPAHQQEKALLHPELNLHGHASDVLGIGQNLSEHKQAEHLAKRTRTRLEEAQRIGRIGNWELDLVNHALTCSDEIYRIFEIEPIGSTVTFDDLMSRIHPEDRDRVKHAYAESVEQRRTYDVEHRLLLSDGWVKHVHQRGETELETTNTPKLLIGTVQDVTQSKTLEMALRKREEEFRSLLDNSPDVIVRYDAQCRRIYINVAHAKVTGRQTLLGKTPTEDWAVPTGPEEAEAFQAQLQAILNTGKPREWELEWTAADGSPICFLLRGTPEFDHDGKVTSVLTFASDISVRKRLEAANIAREQEFRALAENSPDFITRFDSECRRIYTNPSLSRLLGDAALGTTPTEHYPGYPPAQDYENLLRHVLETGEEQQFILHFPDLEGHVHSSDMRIVAERDSQGRIIGTLAIGRDISDRLRMEEALAVREREFRTLAENSPDPIFRYDRECRRIYVNPTVEQITGKRAAELLNRVPEDHNILSAEESAKLVQGVRKVLATGEPVELEVAYLTPNGEKRYFHNRYAPEWSSDGQVTSVLSICRDITERKLREFQEKVRLEIFERLAHGGELGEILNLVVQHVEMTHTDLLCSILLLDADGSTLETGAAPSLPAAYNSAIHGIKIGDSVGSCGTAAWLNESVLVEDIATHPYWAEYKELALSHGLRACWSEPIRDAGGKVLGTFAVYRKHPGLPTAEEVSLIRQTSHLAAIAIERKRIEERMRHQASYDALTGLPNRRMFGYRLHEEIAKASRNAGNVSLLFIDLDRFKEVNDTLGHEVGDQLLVEAAQRIRACVRESDTVARLGGDEFVVVLPDMAEVPHLARISQDIIEAIIRPFTLGLHSAYVSASIGIASYPGDAADVEHLIRCADQAMYAAKEQGRNGFSFFTRAMQDEAQKRLLLANDLRDALARNQLQVYFQPIIEIASGRVVKAEALLRWKHPHYGWISPDQFIPIAEETDLIHKISDWVLQEAAVIAIEWNFSCREHDAMSSPRQISINISPRQFAKGVFHEIWLDYLRTMDIDPRWFTFEITEGLLLSDKAEVMHKLQQIHDAGIQVALDDFGTGYSAMAYLKKFNVDYLKIDRSFVRDLETDPNDRAIAEAIVVMAHKLGLKVIAEGVETIGQRDMLAAVDCDYVQGFLYAKPMPPAEFLSFTAQQQISPVV